MLESFLLSRLTRQFLQGVLCSLRASLTSPRFEHADVSLRQACHGPMASTFPCMITGAFQDGTIQIPCANVSSNVCLKSRERPFTRITPRNASSYQSGEYDGGLENLQLYDVTSSDN
jgi:hypothetical protein